MAKPPDSPPKGAPVAARDAHPPWASDRPKPPPNEPLEVRLKTDVRLREACRWMWGPLSDEEYVRRLELGEISVTYLKVTPDRKPLKSMTKLKAARKKALELGAVVREEAFDDWLNRHVVKAERPDEWTQSRVLYENYLKRAKDYGQNRPDKRLAKEELATETRWGKMMGAQFPNKKRTRDGWFYPIRLKRGA